MKTKHCQNCGTDMDYTLGNCPECGKVVPGGTFWGFVKFFILANGVLIILGMIASQFT